MSSSGLGMAVHSLVLSIHIFSADHSVAHCPSSPKDDSVEAITVCDMPEPCKFPSLDSCEKRFLWTQKEAELAPHPVISLVLPVGDTEKFCHVHGFESLDPSTSSLLC